MIGAAKSATPERVLTGSGERTTWSETRLSGPGASAAGVAWVGGVRPSESQRKPALPTVEVTAPPPARTGRHRTGLGVQCQSTAQGKVEEETENEREHGCALWCADGAKGEAAQCEASVNLLDASTTTVKGILLWPIDPNPYDWVLC